MPLPSLLCLSFSNLATDPRVNRQIRLLSPHYRLTAAGYADPHIDGVGFVPLPNPMSGPGYKLSAGLRLLTRSFESYYWNLNCVRRAVEVLGGKRFDLIIANDSDTWPLAVSLRGSGRVLFDAHEFPPREFEDLWWWRTLFQPYRDYLCRRYLHQADGVTTVCTGIAEEFARCYGIHPAVVMNMPPLRIAPPLPALQDRIRMIHHGAAIRSRKIETMILALDHLDERFTLDLMLTDNDQRYLARLRQLASGRSRVRFRRPVPMNRIPEETRDYELGLFLLEPTNFNYLHALPNKFFEFIQARLAIAIGPSPEMARLVKEHDLGVIAQDFKPQSLADALRVLTPEKVAQFKQNAHRAADVLCWENERTKLLSEIQRLLASKPCVA